MLFKKRLCRIIVNDEVNSVIEGLTEEDVNTFYKQYGLFAANYFFSPKYKLGIWDGKIRFFSKAGKTLTYLLDELIPKLIQMGYSPKLDDRRTGPYVDVDLIKEDVFSFVIKNDKPMMLRYYQVDAVNALIAKGKGLIEAATSAGKTWINAALVNAYGIFGMRSITIVPSSGLVIQTIKDFKSAQLDVGEYSGDVKDLSHQHIVCTWQALKNHPHIVSQFQVIVVDEVHQAKSKVLHDLVNVHGKNIPYRFGLTGTLPKDDTDKLTIHTAFGNVEYVVPAHELIEEGFISTVNIQIKQLFENHPEGYFPDWDAEKSYLQIRRERLSWIADMIIEKSSLPKGNTFVLVSSVTVGKKLQKLIPNSVFLCGKDKAKDRKVIYDLFDTSNNMTVIATVQIAGTGLSIDRIFHLFFIDIGKSFTRVIQGIGRGLRKGGDKDHIDAYDVCSNLKYSKRHLALRIQYYKDAKYPYKKELVKYRNYDDNFGLTQEELLQEIQNSTSLDY